MRPLHAVNNDANHSREHSGDGASIAARPEDTVSVVDQAGAEPSGWEFHLSGTEDEG